MRILLIEDNPTETLLISEGLAELADFRHELVHVEQLAEGIARLDESDFDVVLLDLGLPGSTGIDTFREFQRHHPGVAVLVLTGLEDTEVSLLALHEGAQDYVIKKDIQSSILSRAIRYAVERHRLTSEAERSRDRLRMLTIRLQEAREDERLRISRELHDELGQKMSALKMDLRWIEKHLHGFATPEGIRATRQRVLESLTLTDDAIERVQRIAFELRPSALDHLGLAGAMREEARRFEARTGIRMKLVLPDSLTVSDAGLATMFFRIFQELLTNVARHAKAEEVTATFKQVDGELVMDLSDDGIGLPPGALGANRSLGLLGIQERAAAHEGSVIFDSVAGEGTSVSVRVPAVGSKAGAP